MERDQIRIAREYRGLSQTGLAGKVDGLSQSNLSKYESGLLELSANVKERIMMALDFPAGFLLVDARNVVENEHYRKRKNIKAEDKRKIEGAVAMIGYWIDTLAEPFDLPDYNFGCYDLCDGYTATEVARQVRRKFRLGNAPIDDICTLLENNGVIIYLWNCECEGFDGVSFTTSNGNVVLIANANISNDRLRFTIAHELGHIIMHENTDTFIPDFRNKEAEANEFASEFLYPNVIAKSQLCNVTMARMPALKGYWKLSMQAILEKAYRNEYIYKNKYVQLRGEFSRKGWIKKEPYPVDLPRPTIIDNMQKMSASELGQGIDELRKRAQLPLDFLRKPKRSNVVAIF